jgi:tRNA (cytidine56-2'-O)-methyltransferase
MQGEPEVAVLRYGHRPGRDDRMTTHVGLTARALGADRVVLPDNATQSAETVRDITGRFGGPFDVELTEELDATIERWGGAVVHLTMYGEQVQDVEADVREAHRDEPLLVVVGGEKVPGDVYEHADWNLAVTNQPHSEVAGLAVFLDRLFDGRELDQNYEGAERRVVPEELGKHVVDVDEDESGVEAGQESDNETGT